MALEISTEMIIKVIHTMVEAPRFYRDSLENGCGNSSIKTMVNKSIVKAQIAPGHVQSQLTKLVFTLPQAKRAKNITAVAAKVTPISACGRLP
jgi:hypothetical protein